MGVELPIADVLDVVSARMPYLDGGRITSALPANRGATARQGRHLSSVLSVALRDLHDERRLNLRVMGDATDLRELAPDPLHEVASVKSIVILEPDDA